MKDRPLIGLPTYNAYNGDPEFVMHRAYCRAIEAAGGVPLLLPLVEEEAALRHLYALLDGLLLCGGGDVAPERYGAADTGQSRLVDHQRDRVEIALTRWALADGMPVLGICRGIQTLNVAAGGTLIQDVPSEIGGSVEHQSGRDRAVCVVHPVMVEADSRLAASLGLDGQAHEAATVGVNSTHHQAVEEVAPGFAVTARAPDGVIEGIERDGGETLVLGVQWHPERLIPQHAEMARLFRRFVSDCGG